MVDFHENLPIQIVLSFSVLIVMNCSILLKRTLKFQLNKQKNNNLILHFIFAIDIYLFTLNNVCFQINVESIM